jgi:hypothetical protein
MTEQSNEQPSHGWKYHNISERFIDVNKVRQFHGVDVVAIYVLTIHCVDRRIMLALRAEKMRCGHQPPRILPSTAETPHARRRTVRQAGVGQV